jgi:hypothetical protein
MALVRMTHCWPEALRPVEPEQWADVGGRRVRVTERVPQSPTRPARPWEVGGWWEDVPDVSAPAGE